MAANGVGPSGAVVAPGDLSAPSWLDGDSPTFPQGHQLDFGKAESVFGDTRCDRDAGGPVRRSPGEIDGHLSGNQSISSSGTIQGSRSAESRHSTKAGRVSTARL